MRHDNGVRGGGDKADTARGWWYIDRAGSPTAGRATMKRLCAIFIVMFIVLPIVAGCDSRKDDLAACRIEAVRRHPEKDGGSLKDYSDFVTACMREKGYTVTTPGQ